jgi:hypothetical protein
MLTRQVFFDDSFAMTLPTDPLLGPHPPAFAQLLAQIAQADWFCHGTVVCRPLRRKVAGQWVQKGPYCLWTGKREGKTICYALSREQYRVAKRAIAANRKVMAAVGKLQTLTLERILKKVPGVRKRK